jgi:hypothetical protein
MAIITMDKLATQFYGGRVPIVNSRVEYEETCFESRLDSATKQRLYGVHKLHYGLLHRSRLRIYVGVRDVLCVILWSRGTH